MNIFNWILGFSYMLILGEIEAYQRVYLDVRNRLMYTNCVWVSDLNPIGFWDEARRRRTSSSDSGQHSYLQVVMMI